MNEAKKKRAKTGGRQKGTPNKMSKKIAKAIFEDYFYCEVNVDKSEEKTTRLVLLMKELEKIALTSKKELIKIKAIDIILKTLGAYNNKVEIDAQDNKINIRIIDN